MDRDDGRTFGTIDETEQSAEAVAAHFVDPGQPPLGRVHFADAPAGYAGRWPVLTENEREPTWALRHAAIAVLEPYHPPRFHTDRGQPRQNPERAARSRPQRRSPRPTRGFCGTQAE
ncbi:hypothetical protein [Fimbriiglobus ruber]|uniref:Uncharacterized protein n=1 Tax=Fimbriiglobus ruber TaxID=1908690 RepID=A0A225DFH6_9BACT|nr:hypothetical protein [Fimbriiglobus ruber]OWK38404.1 hypothetical protein FRUB_07524 [Fimbriiglobus ruber]